MTIKNETMDKIHALIRRADENQLLELNEAIGMQFKVVRQQKALTNRRLLEVGSRVRIVKTARPKYLAGQTGVIYSMDGGRPTVQLDCGPLQRFANGRVTMRNAAGVELI